MNKKIIIMLLIAVVVAAGILLRPISSTKADHKNASYTLDGRQITMHSPGITYFGNEAYGDVNGDGQEDVVFLFTYDGGGSGTFYYVAAALKTAEGYWGTNAFLVGDRIAPQNISIDTFSIHGISQSEINVNFAMRKPGEPMTAQPTHEAVLLLKVTKAGVLEGLMK